MKFKDLLCEFGPDMSDEKVLRMEFLERLVGKLELYGGNKPDYYLDNDYLDNIHIAYEDEVVLSAMNSKDVKVQNEINKFLKENKSVKVLQGRRERIFDFGNGVTLTIHYGL